MPGAEILKKSNRGMLPGSELRLRQRSAVRDRLRNINPEIVTRALC